jgi:hypothetical protein
MLSILAHGFRGFGFECGRGCQGFFLLVMVVFVVLLVVQGRREGR